MGERRRSTAAILALATIFALLSLARPIDHDESQYVAAATLSARGLLPFRDYAYLQTPLQPLLFAPIAWIAGAWTWPALRLVNAALGAATVALTAMAARAGGASPRAAAVAAGLFATTDILLFSIGTARNDALPAACLAGALLLAMRAERQGATGAAAFATGLLLAAAGAAKISYAFPAAAYGAWAAVHRRHRPLAVAAGAVLPLALVAACWATAPDGFVFGTLHFPSLAPIEYYVGTGRAGKLDLAAKAIDTLKFLALGPALLALAAGMRRVERRPVLPAALPALLVAAGLLAALLPTPVWRQYFLPALPPLFVRLAQLWTDRPPRRPLRIAATMFAVAGLVPTAAALVGGTGVVAAQAQSRAIGRAMDRAGVPADLPVATLSPQFLPGAGRRPDPRFATGPFYFRSRALLSRAEERRLILVSQARLPRQVPPIVLVGGEGRWTSGDPALDAVLEGWAIRGGLRRIDVPGGRFRLYVRAPGQAAR